MPSSHFKYVGDKSWDIFSNSTLNEIINKKILDLFKCELESRDLKYGSQHIDFLSVCPPYHLYTPNKTLIQNGE